METFNYERLTRAELSLLNAEHAGTGGGLTQGFSGERKMLVDIWLELDPD